MTKKNKMRSGKTHFRLPTMAYVAAFIYSLLGEKKKLKKNIHSLKKKKAWIYLVSKLKIQKNYK